MATATHMHGRIGESIKRKEDARFLRGKGNYLDDFVLPNMLEMAILRSPHAHARINSIDTTAASAMPGVIAVVTGELMAQHKLAWMPTLSGDTQAVLATDKVRFQGQEVAAVIAETKYQAEDARDAILVDYEILPAVTSPDGAKGAGAPLIRDDKEGQKDNHIYHWEAGNQATTQAAFATAHKVVRLTSFYPRCHPAPLETCGCLADVDPASGKATIYMTSQAPHAIRTVFALVTGLPEQEIRVISPDIGGGFGNKVPVYPGYVVATAASLLLGRPVKWVEDRNENLISTGFARDFHMTGELALDADGRMLALRAHLDSDNGAFFADAQPSKFKAGLFHIVTGSYDLAAAHVSADGWYTNKAPGGIAYRCSFRVTEASYLIERLVTNAAIELRIDQAELRLRNFIQPEAFPYRSATGWEYDSGDYPRALRLALEKVGYQQLREEQKRLRQQGQLMGIGIASFTEVVGAGPGKDYDILGLRMFDSAELRVHPTGKAIQDVALAAYTNLPDGMEAGLEGVHYYDPPNMTFPFGSYVVVVDLDKGTGQVKVRRMVAVDDCGVRINPMIVEGQLHGGLTEGFGIAFMELITFDEEGNCLGSNFTDYLLPTSWETPKFEMGETVTPSPHHPIGAKGVGGSATVGSPAAFVNAVIDAVGHLGIRNIDMPVTSDKVWAALSEKGAAE